MYGDHIIRYRPGYNTKLELVYRIHDLGGTSYEHVCWFTDFKDYPDAYFLYDDERLEWIADLKLDDPDKVVDEVKVFKVEEVYVYTKPQVHICETSLGA